MATEFVEVAKGLWDSWEDGAIVMDKAAGRFADISKMHELNFKGQFYSDKSPVPSLAMAAVYKGLQLITGITAAVHPGWFCYLLALVFGTFAAAALSRARFFGRETISLLFVLPIALPGIITGISLRSAFDIMGLDFSIWTIVLGHATFCIVVVYNNAIARFRRLSGNIIEASMDLGANSFQTFWYVILPQIGTALLAGGMLAFALSFDEVIVTTFTAGQQATLPIWMLAELIRPRQRPVTNVVAVFVVVVTFLPILAAYYLTREGEHTGGSSK